MDWSIGFRWEENTKGVEHSSVIESITKEEVQEKRLTFIKLFSGQVDEPLGHGSLGTRR